MHWEDAIEIVPVLTIVVRSHQLKTALQSL
jgi:hypothetical protein